MTLLSQIDRALMALIAAVLAASVVIAFVNPTYFWATFAAEDGLVEYGTAICLFASSVVLAFNARGTSARGLRLAAVLTMLYALMFFLAAGEEVSWGQRVFGWESGEFFQNNNKQDETNFHNLMIGDIHLTKTLFGPILTFCILLYLVVLPLLYTRSPRIAALADRFAVPVPWLRHGLIALVASIIITVIDVQRKWEVYELVFSLLTVSIFLLPQNRDKVT
ncbi:hypothetical protein G5B38_15570 [Pseudohalocynthiibacter aestuariivivens]|uniref:O-Antigen ligase n=1 Tax=Roseovarius pelagicus TaxID=2980108 RepID=A0ABY6DHA8_9RHOB|nr:MULTISPECIES: hypothetical protein [Rhodobacterales]QIE46825.1 hypothetical protein G5B38_15570 [Pseudohalocynthiibacter aestuariivivens]UXX84633.1 hypothetical protein N7U68_08350 [Roseovarius pelagicus]